MITQTYNTNFQNHFHSCASKVSIVTLIASVALATIGASIVAGLFPHINVAWGCACIGVGLSMEAISAYHQMKICHKISDTKRALSREAGLKEEELDIESAQNEFLESEEITSSLQGEEVEEEDSDLSIYCEEEDFGVDQVDLGEATLQILMNQSDRKRVDLSGKLNGLSEIEKNALIKSLPQFFSSLNSLDLNDNFLSHENLNELGRVLCQLPMLTHLNLSGNSIVGDELTLSKGIEESLLFSC